MAEANLNLQVDTTQAQKNLELVTDKVIDQEAQIAKLRISLVEAEQDLANFNFKANYPTFKNFYEFFSINLDLLRK